MSIHEKLADDTATNMLVDNLLLPYATLKFSDTFVHQDYFDIIKPIQLFISSGSEIQPMLAYINNTYFKGYLTVGNLRCVYHYLLMLRILSLYLDLYTEKVGFSIRPTILLDINQSKIIANKDYKCNEEIVNCKGLLIASFTAADTLSPMTSLNDGQFYTMIGLFFYSNT